MKFGSLFSGIGGFDLGEDDAITTICDGCGCEIHLVEANYAGPELPLWEGATLCSECYAVRHSCINQWCLWTSKTLPNGQPAF